MVILLVTIALVSVVTVRIYATGVLLYGQRPGSARLHRRRAAASRTDGLAA